jgi:hypothetical protein
MTDHNPLSAPKVRIVDDHEISMARAQTYRAAKCAMQIHKMLQQVDNLEGWMQSKITLAADYLESVSANLEYDIVSAVMEPEPELGISMPPSDGITSSMQVPGTHADLVEQTPLQQAERDGYAVAAAMTKNPNVKLEPPHPAGPEQQAWKKGLEKGKNAAKQGIVPSPR